MSAALLKSPTGKTHERSDDLESLLHIAFYHVLRYRPMVTTGQLQQIISDVFDAHIVEGETTGGVGKAAFIDGHYPSTRMLQSAMSLPPALRAFLYDLRALFKPLYADDISPDRLEAAHVKLYTRQALDAIFVKHADGEWLSDDCSADQLPREA